MEAKLIMSTFLNKNYFMDCGLTNNNLPVDLRVCNIHNFQPVSMGLRLLFNPGEVSGLCNGLCC